MAKYHVNSKGEAGVCRARISCPYGDLERDHFPTKEEARKAYETGRLDDTFSTLKKTIDEVLDPHESTDDELLEAVERAGWKHFDPEAGPEQLEYDPPEGWAHQSDELQEEMAAHYEAERQAKLAALTTARDYFDADDEGMFMADNSEATAEELTYGKTHSVIEAIGRGDSLRGFTTLQLLDQLSIDDNPATSTGRKNLAIRRELNERFTGFPRLKPVKLSTSQDFTAAYDAGRFHEHGISNSESDTFANSWRSKGKHAFEAAEANKDLSGFTSQELVDSLYGLGGLTASRQKAQARMTNELRLRLKGEEFIPEGLEPPF